MSAFVGFWVCFAFALQPREIRSDPPPVLLPEASAHPAPARSSPAPAEPPVPLLQPLPVLPANTPDTILIDPGHGGDDGGTVANDLLEKDWALKIGQDLAAELRRRGHKVEMTRDSDATLSLTDRWQRGNARPFLAFLSVHLNAGPADATGVETYYSWPKKPEVMAQLHASQGLPLDATPADEGEALASRIQEKTAASVESRDRGVRNRDDLAVTSRTTCPAVLIECAFLTNPLEAVSVQDSSWRQRLVRGIADGFEDWLRNRTPPRPSAATTPLPVLPGTKSQTAGDQEH